MRNFISYITARKKMMTVLLLSIVLTAVLVSGEKLQDDTTTLYLPIEHIEIEGKFENLLQTKIQQAVLNVIDGGYFTVDIDALRMALLDLPWVEDVSIRRRWPAGLSISVTEKKAIAYWGNDQLLSDAGILFKPDQISHELQLPRIDGPEGTHKSVWYFFKESNKKLENLSISIDRLLLDKRRAWQMRLSNDIVVKLGRENTDNRLQRLIKVYATAVAPRMKDGLKAIEAIDLRYPNGFAMRMKNTKSDLNRGTLVKEV